MAENWEAPSGLIALLLAFARLQSCQETIESVIDNRWVVKPIAGAAAVQVLAGKLDIDRTACRHAKNLERITRVVKEKTPCVPLVPASGV